MDEVEVLKDGRIKVNTPKPYIIDAPREYEKSEMEAMIGNLRESVRFLRDCLRVLGVSEDEARKKEYTLNSDTGERLRELSYSKHISMEMWKVIFSQHDW